MSNNLPPVDLNNSPGNGNTTLSRKLHEHFQSTYFEFGWIPEFRMLAPSMKISQKDEEQLSFENLILVSKDYNQHGYKNVIITDLDDVRMLDIQSINTNALIKRRITLPNEYRILNSRDDSYITLEETLDILEKHVPSDSNDISQLTRADYYSCINE
jgi:hypothetical protein